MSIPCLKSFTDQSSHWNKNLNFLPWDLFIMIPPQCLISPAFSAIPTHTHRPHAPILLFSFWFLVYDTPIPASGPSHMPFFLSGKVFLLILHDWLFTFQTICSPHHTSRPFSLYHTYFSSWHLLSKITLIRIYFFSIYLCIEIVSSVKTESWSVFIHYRIIKSVLSEWMNHKLSGHISIWNCTSASTPPHFSLAYFLIVGIQVSRATTNRGYNCLITCLR